MISLHPSSARPQTSASIPSMDSASAPRILALPSICHHLFFASSCSSICRYFFTCLRDSSALYLCLLLGFSFAFCPARVRHSLTWLFFVIRRFSDFSADPFLLLLLLVLLPLRLLPLLFAVAAAARVTVAVVTVAAPPSAVPWLANNFLLSSTVYRSGLPVESQARSGGTAAFASHGCCYLCYSNKHSFTVAWL